MFSATKTTGVAKRAAKLSDSWTTPSSMAPVAEVGHGDVTTTVHLRGEAGSNGERNRRAHYGNRADEPDATVLKVHRAAHAVRTAGGLAQDLG